MINLNKEIWEGWTVNDFVDAIEDTMDNYFEHNKFYTYKDVKETCMYEQPYYKEYIPEVVEYFCNKYNVGYK